MGFWVLFCSVGHAGDLVSRSAANFPIGNKACETNGNSFLFLCLLFSSFFPRVDHKTLITALRYEYRTHSYFTCTPCVCVYECVCWYGGYNGIFTRPPTRTTRRRRSTRSSSRRAWATMAQRRCKCPKKVAATKWTRSEPGLNPVAAPCNGCLRLRVKEVRELPNGNSS